MKVKKMINLVKKTFRTKSSFRFVGEILRAINSGRETPVKRFADICVENNVKFVFDIGANVGQFAVDLRRHHFCEEIFSFEPVPRIFEELAQNLRKDAKWRGFQLGVGHAVGDFKIQISGNSGLSTSFLEMDKVHLENFPESHYVDSETVSVTTLSDQISQLGIDARKLAVKIDVQGFELEVLKGAMENLAEINCLIIEVSLVPLYVGEAAFKDILIFLEKHNHKIVDIFRGVKSKTGDLLQVDIISVRNSL